MLESLPISRKLAVAFGGIFMIAAIAMGFVFMMAHHVSTLSAQNELYDREQSLAAEVETSLLRAVGHFRAFEAGNDPAQAVAYQESMTDFERHAEELAPLLTHDRDIKLLESTRSAAQTWRSDVADPAIARAKLGEVARSGAGAHMIEGIISGAEKLRHEKHLLVEGALEDIRVAGARQDRVILIGGIAMLAVAFVMWLLLRRQIGRPVVEMTDAMRDLAHGNNSVDVPAIGRGDEIGAMADAVLIFRDNAVAKAQAEARKAVADAEQKKVVETLSDGLGKLSEGDLTTVIGDEFPSSYSEIRDNFNGALGSLRALVGSVMESTETIRNGSSEIADASEELAQRSQTSAASLEETTAAVTEINQRIGAAAKAATKTNARAGEAIQTVSHGRGVTDAAVQAMNRVSDSAQGIDDVIEGLDKIAFQTRVLAMNAAVEAGRAGEAGRGFAVVADLVSALAMRAEEEAKRAREQLTATRSDIATAVDAVRDVDGALGSIAGGVREVHDLVASMEVDNRAQADAVSEITGAVTTMDLATQRNAAMVEETSAASRTLSHEVAALARQTARFRIDIVGTVAGRAKPAFAQTLH